MFMQFSEKQAQCIVLLRHLRLSHRLRLQSNRSVITVSYPLLHIQNKKIYSVNRERERKRKAEKVQKPNNT